MLRSVSGLRSAHPVIALALTALVTFCVIFSSGTESFDERAGRQLSERNSLRARDKARDLNRRRLARERAAALAAATFAGSGGYDAGPPVSAVVPAGQCVFGGTWRTATLQKRVTVAQDTVLLTFGLADPSQPLGLSTCACLLARGGAGADGQPVVRPYTPVSTNALRGAFELLVKVYPQGVLSRHLGRTLAIGSTMDFRHVPMNVKIQYPFASPAEPARRIGMIVGGTGITPMLQALHALLGTANDASDISLLYSNRAQQDILARPTLERWEAAHARRFRIYYTLTRETRETSWSGLRGRIDAPMLRAHLPPPSDPRTLLFVCGPPEMYAALSGPRNEKALSGTLAALGYSAAQVVKF